MFHKRQSGILVISPSGNFYGSEQVLLDYLKTTRHTVDVMVPLGSMFLDILLASGLRHRVLSYNGARLPFFYTRVFTWLLSGKYDVVYLNEAGHNRYIVLLARIFSNKKFIIHVRIKEDTDISRWKHIPENVQIITISQYMRDLMPMESTLLYDSYIFSEQVPGSLVNNVTGPLRIGVIGRISSTKGVHELMDLLKTVQTLGSEQYHFYLFGEAGSDIIGTDTLEKILSYPAVTLMGFVKNKHEIYGKIDVVLHLSKTEPLGRIFFEAIEAGKPLIGFNSAGIGEIGDMTGLKELLADPSVKDNGIALFEKLEIARNNYSGYVGKVMAIKQKASEVFDINNYSATLDKFMAP